MNRLALTLKRLNRWERRSRPRGIIQLTLFALFFGLGMFCKEQECGRSLDTAAYFEDRHDRKHDELERYQNLLAAKAIELDVMEKSRLAMEKKLKVEQEKRSELLKNVAFYRSVLHPEATVEGIYINHFQLQRTAVPYHYRFSLLLSQLNRKRYAIKGKYRVEVVGVESNKRVQYQLSDLLLNKKKSSNKFSFRYYQEFMGEIVLPKHFYPKRVVVYIDVPSNRWRNIKSIRKEWRFHSILSSS